STSGKVVRGFIGVQETQLSARQAAQVGLPAGTTGIIVTQVVPGSPATQAGIRVNDIITQVNDQLIDPQHPLQSLMVKFRPGDKVTLALIRDGSEQAVDVALGVVAGALPAAVFTRGRSRRAAILLGGTVTGVGIFGILVSSALFPLLGSAMLVGFGGIIASSSGAALLADATVAARRATRFG